MSSPGTPPPSDNHGQSYAEVYRRSTDSPEDFWLAAAEAVEWVTPPTQALDDSAAPMYRWFPDASLNTCFNALDRHVRDGNGDRAALIYDSAMAPLHPAPTPTQNFSTRCPGSPAS